MSLGLLGAAYLTDGSDASDEDEENNSVEQKTLDHATTKESQVTEKLDNPFAKSSHGAGRLAPVLPRPSFMQEAEVVRVGVTGSVFSNPFREAESAKAAILEQHVGMTAGQRSEGKMIDGKKVCWMFRKGRCRHGHKCSFAHDNDIASSLVEKMYTPKYDSESQLSGGKSAGSVAPLSVAPREPAWRQMAAKEQAEEEEMRARKKRPGLSQGLVPSKKAMKFHEKVYLKQ